MYEISPSWSRSLVPFHSLSFTNSLTHTGFSTTVDIVRYQCKGFKSRLSTQSQLRIVSVFLSFLDANRGFNMRICIFDGVYLFYKPFMQLLNHYTMKLTYQNIQFNTVSQDYLNLMFFDNSTSGFAQSTFSWQKLLLPKILARMRKTRYPYLENYGRQVRILHVHTDGKSFVI